MLLAAVLLVVGGTIAARTSSGSAGRVLVEIPAVGATIEFPEGTHTDLGMVEPGDNYSHRFAVHNLGPGEFRYADFDWGCKPCAHMDLVLEPDPLLPGQHGHLILSSEVRGFLKGAEIRTFPVLLASDRTVKVFEISVAQETPWEPTIEVTVQELRFADIWESGDPKVMEAKVRLDLPPELRSPSLSVESNTQGVSGVLEAEPPGKSETAQGPSRYLILKTKVDPQALPLGPFNGTLTVRADFGTSELRVSGKIVEALSVQPDPLLIKKQDADPAVGYVVLRNLTGEDLIMEQASSDAPGIECEDLSPGNSALKKLRVSVEEPDRLSGESKIELKCRLGKKPHVIPVRILPW